MSLLLLLHIMFMCICQCIIIVIIIPFLFTFFVPDLFSTEHLTGLSAPPKWTPNTSPQPSNAQSNMNKYKGLHMVTDLLKEASVALATIRGKAGVGVC